VKYWYENVVVRKRGRIPHWHVPNGLYFVTYRLADSLPRHVEHEIALLRAHLVATRARDYDSFEAREIERNIFKLTETELDQSRGECWLRNAEVAKTIVASFDHDDGKDYEMVAFAVMPNHVHVVFRLKGELDDVIKRWKSYTAHRANEILRRSGTFWQSNYFDVLMRDSEQLQRTIQYVLDNPAKAGLRDWPHTQCWPDRIMNLI
jgi:REP element-mobilizing transposase RayT